MSEWSSSTASQHREPANLKLGLDWAKIDYVRIILKGSFKNAGSLCWIFTPHLVSLIASYLLLITTVYSMQYTVPVMLDNWISDQKYRLPSEAHLFDDISNSVFKLFKTFCVCPVNAFQLPTVRCTYHVMLWHSARMTITSVALWFKEQRSVTLSSLYISSVLCALCSVLICALCFVRAPRALWSQK